MVRAAGLALSACSRPSRLPIKAAAVGRRSQFSCIGRSVEIGVLRRR